MLLPATVVRHPSVRHLPVVRDGLVMGVVLLPVGLTRRDTSGITTSAALRQASGSRVGGLSEAADAVHERETIHLRDNMHGTRSAP